MIPYILEGSWLTRSPLLADSAEFPRNRFGEGILEIKTSVSTQVDEGKLRLACVSRCYAIQLQKAEKQIAASAHNQLHLQLLEPRLHRQLPFLAPSRSSNDSCWSPALPEKAQKPSIPRSYDIAAPLNPTPPPPHPRNSEKNPRPQRRGKGPQSFTKLGPKVDSFIP